MTCCHSIRSKGQICNNITIYLTVLFTFSSAQKLSAESPGAGPTQQLYLCQVRSPTSLHTIKLDPDKLSNPLS
jgi:hypothetical protein